MTTEKEFWNLAGQYFRKELGISEDEQAIDEDCVGCCKVVDVAAKLQAELDATRNMYRVSSDECCKQRKTIGDLRETIDNFKTIETKETDRLHEIILDMDVTISDLMNNDRKINGFLDEYRATVDNRDKTIEELKDSNINDLRELWDLNRAELTSVKSDYEIMRTNHLNTVAKLRADIKGLEVELSTRKEDSEVLMKVVGAVRDWQADPINPRHMIERIRHITENCLDAPEGPPETPIDDLYRVTVTYAFLEMP